MSVKNEIEAKIEILRLREEIEKIKEDNVSLVN